VEAVGEGVTQWTPGQRVGVGWFGGADHTCAPCRRGDFISCLTMCITGLTDDGGYADYLVSPADPARRRQCGAGPPSPTPQP
jgi:D-arabinose 1-dehydrogenase-like Zn-dependent alcohol dehydrogenase